jgi:phenylpyruvate tautomerase PptA (4-oxalocrotonate tautomerase family)
MPLVRISVSSSTPPDTRTAIASAVYEAMRESIKIPDGDRFVVLSTHDSGELIADPNFPNVHRSQKFTLVQIFLARGRTVDQKQALYTAIAEQLERSAGIPQDDVMIVLTENELADWSFGKGEAHYVLHPPAWSKNAADQQGN